MTEFLILTTLYKRECTEIGRIKVYTIDFHYIEFIRNNVLSQMHKTVNPRTNVSVRKIRLSQKFNENRKFKRAQCIISRMEV